MSRPTVWVCPACGKVGATRETVGDTTCEFHAVEVYVDSLVRSINGLVAATAVPRVLIGNIHLTEIKGVVSV